MIDDQKPSDGNAPNTEPEGSSDVHLIEVGNRKIYLVGTAHVSQQSVDLVREVIDRLNEWRDVRERTITAAEEKMVFKLPRELLD